MSSQHHNIVADYPRMKMARHSPGHALLTCLILEVGRRRRIPGGDQRVAALITNIKV